MTYSKETKQALLDALQDASSRYKEEKASLEHAVKYRMALESSLAKAVSNERHVAGSTELWWDKFQALRKDYESIFGEGGSNALPSVQTRWR